MARTPQDGIRNDYAHCVECSRSGAIRVLKLFGQEIAFDRFNSDHTDMWAKNDEGWHARTTRISP